MSNTHLCIGCILIGGALSAAVHGDDLGTQARAARENVRAQIRQYQRVEREVQAVARATRHARQEAARTAERN